MKPLYKQRNFPVFQNRVYGSKREALDCARGDIVLVQDPVTGLVHNAAFDPSLMIYDENYQNEQGVSKVFQKHLLQVADVVRRNIGNRNLVEVGCGKGLFLDILLRQGCDVTGFDPAYEGDSARIEKRPFDHRAGMTANGIILRHVLEHIKNPVGFLQELKVSNGGTGLIYIEVPDFEWICQHRAWFDIYYEHVNYFRPGDFLRIFDTILDSGRLFGNQYLYVVADLGSLRHPAFRKEDEVSFPEDFLVALQNVDSTTDGPAAVWGGSSKGVIFSLLRSRIGRPPSFVVDINPRKQGRYLPATGIRVCSPGECLRELPAGGTLHVMNVNYLPEIEELTHRRYKYDTLVH